MQTEAGLRQRARTLLAQIEAQPLSEHTEPWAFENRLADQNSWTLGHATQATREYRRFLVLTQLAGHEVCPSADVDEAWHLHLTQSRAYAQMCAKVFGRFLHHDPSKGGAGEDTRHREMYARTLQRYEQLFGEPPNPEVWPDVQRRFGPDQARLRPAERPASMRLPAPLHTRKGLATAAVLLAVVVGWMAARWGVLGPWPGLSSATALGWYLGALMVLVVLHLGVPLTAKPATNTPQPPTTLDAYEVAWLSAGPTRVAATVVAEGVARRWYRLDAARTKRGRIGGANLIVDSHPTAAPGSPTPPHPVWLAAQHAEPGQTVRPGAIAWRLGHASGEINRRLAAAGLAWLPGQYPLKPLVLMGLAALLLCLATARAVHGVAAQRPVFFLLALMLGNAVLMAALAKPSRPTPAGRRVLDRLAARLRAEGSQWPPKSDDPVARQRAAELLPMSFAVLGTAAVMADPDFAGINFVVSRDSLARTGTSDGGGGCSATSVDGGGGGSGGDGGGGDGGGGCGGGCGGGG